MQAAAAEAEGRSRGSPSAMDNADESAKKARLEPPNGHLVKQELVAHEAAAGGGAIVAAAPEHSPRAELAVKIDMCVLHCPLCTLPFKPPVFQCKGGHFACGVCVTRLPCSRCKACVDGGGLFGPCPALDAVVSSTRVQCPNAGCQRYVTYHEAGEHQSACPHAPCRCTEPGCEFVGAAPLLAGHLQAVHSVPMRSFQYGKVSRIQVPVSAPRLLLLVCEDDGCVFLLTVGALGASASAVSVVCARPSAATRPRFTCKMWANLAASNGGKMDIVLVEMQMRSSTSPGAVVAASEPTFLAVPAVYLVPGADGGGMEMEVALNVRIDKSSPWSD
ncbi:E3 ubiquitin-protein ligase SINA-like 10 [Triticum urartu]|uniref:SIAH-type domain-containing protein n=1 Tax=Triticum urartu TaxID=4572 RepID=A0A8R7PNB6_TRIUA|nr:E3 ubiquitin-protein ligase SINA-like 10 [Triticum urartu]